MAHKTNSFGQAIGADVSDWVDCPYPERKPMVGQYCSLAPLNVDEHGDGLWKAFSENSNPADWTYLPYGPFASKEEFVEWLEEFCTGDDPQFYVVFNHDGQLLGMASYLRIKPEMGVIEVGHIHFSPKLQRTVTATEAMYLMMVRVFDELGYRRYEWKCDSLNLPSCKAAQRLGFSFEGIFRNAVIYKGRNRDTAWYAMTGDDWQHIQPGFEDWLDPSNFDNSGLQMQSLKRCIDVRRPKSNSLENSIDVTFSVELNPTPESIDVLLNGLTSHALPNTLKPGFQRRAIFARDSNNKIVAGITGELNWNWLYIELLWVSEAYRNSGLGANLLRQLETEAKHAGCENAHVETFSFQAVSFYEQHGYKRFAELENYPHGHRRLYLKKVTIRLKLNSVAMIKAINHYQIEN